MPLYYGLFSLPWHHSHLCFSVAIFLPCTPLLPHFLCYQPDHCLEMYMHWSITVMRGFLVERRLRANIQFIFYCSICNRGTEMFSNPLLLMEESKWICTYRNISEDIFDPLWNTKMALKQNVCSDFLCVCIKTIKRSESYQFDGTRYPRASSSQSPSTTVLDLFYFLQKFVLTCFGGIFPPQDETLY